MASTSPFDFVCEQLERSSSLSNLEARGTVRLALKQAGFEARNVSAEELAVVVRKVLPAELKARAVDDADGVCEMLATELKAGDFASTSDDNAPESVFRRLGGA
ncbi:MAG: hypothetical protein R3263_05420 [Myxococcota bacterium]|nr:hypothetical protein [Myxococcota bacterium]